MIKLFEEYNKPTFYKVDNVDTYDSIEDVEIIQFKSAQDYIDFILQNTKVTNFTNQELNLIKNKYNNLNIGHTTIDHPYKPYLRALQRYHIKISTDNQTKLIKGNYTINIDKLQDEWYIVMHSYVSDGNIYHGNEIISNISWHYDWYKCDQLDGLIDCLNHLIK